jgi:hypothetical protein
LLLVALLLVAFFVVGKIHPAGAAALAGLVMIIPGSRAV